MREAKGSVRADLGIAGGRRKRAHGERVVTVLVADISGSTPLGERLDPEELREILAAYFNDLAAAIQRYGGTVDKYIGDAVRAEFEASSSGTAAGAALQAGLAMLEALRKENQALEQRYNVRLSLRVGVNTGPVLSAGPGQPLLGETVELAQRLEHSAPPNQVLAGEATFNLARRGFRFEAGPLLAARAGAPPRRAYRLVGSRRLAPTATHVGGEAAARLDAGASLQVTEREAYRLEEQRKIVTVLFADLTEPLAERVAPKDLQIILRAYFEVVAREVQRFGGTLDKFVGDAVMAVFGAPLSHEDDAVRAIHAALAIQTGLRRENDRFERQFGVALALRIGVNAGEVVAGLLPGEVLAYTVTGDAVNTAQRIESATPPGEVLVGESTYYLARKAFLFEPVAPLTLKGKAQPVPAYRVIGRQLEAAAQAGTTLVGRAAELERLSALFGRAAAGMGQLVHLHAEPGVGKSRLVSEFLARLTNDVWRASARCSSYEIGHPYALVADLVRRAFGVQLADDEARARVALGAALGPLRLPFNDSAVSLLLEILGYGERSGLDPEGKRRQLVSVLSRYLEHRSALGPFVLTLEDVQWIDPASSSTLTDVVTRASQLRLLVMSTSRDEAAPWPTTTIELRHLDDVEASAMVDRAAGKELDSQVRALILERTGGNPFFIEEVVGALISGRATSVPATVQDLLEAKLDSLDAEPKRVVQAAAVIGRTFWTRVLARVTSTEAIHPALATLESERFVAPYELAPEERYAFRHALVQEVSYQTQLLARRRKAHAQVGTVIEELFTGRVDEFTDILAFHFDRGDDDERAVTWLGRAGERAKHLFANAEAITSFSRAIERAQRNPRLADRLPPLVLALAEVRGHVGEYDEALRLFTQARDSTNDLRAWRGMATMLRNKGEYTRALALIEEAIVALSGGPADVLPLSLEKAQTLSVEGRFRNAIEVARSALDAAGERRDTVVAQLLVRLARSEAVAGQGEEALGHARDALEISREYGDVVTELAALRVAGEGFLRLQRLGESADAYGQALKLAERVGAVAEVAGGLLNLGFVERRRGRLEDAIAWDRRAALEFDRIHHGSGRATAYGNLASHLMMHGDYDEALRYAEVAFKIATEIGHVYTIADVFNTIASARVGRGEFHEGASKAEESAKLFVELGARPQAAEALRTAADAWRNLGDEERARDADSRARSVLA
jgi:class 3 adenylate cyclase/tetratricopeptide (TPR) repeat protein